MKTIIIAAMLSVWASPKPVLQNVDNKSTDQNPCRITCTVYINDISGARLGFSATSGGIFTDCATAYQNACMKASMNALAMLKP
jgi:hypothetical protein